jgi:lysylphosphatidylglycerol synthetase-like protein (DUF2156 family)
MSQSDLTGMFALMAFLPIVAAVFLLPTIFFLFTLQKALSRCEPGSRTMVPGQVWLCLVPVFNLIWTFFVVNAVSDSLHREFTRRGMAEEPQPGRSLGMAFAILAVISVVCWILYWVRIAGYSEKIAPPFTAGAPAV